MTTTRKTVLSLALTLTALLALTITASAASYWDGISGGDGTSVVDHDGRFSVIVVDGQTRATERDSR